MTSKKLLTKQFKQQIERIKNHIKCAHEWKPYGYGFRCDKCEHYTGMNEKINKSIKSELTK